MLADFVDKPKKTAHQAALGPAEEACDVTVTLSDKPHESLKDQTKMLSTETEVDPLKSEDEAKARGELNNGSKHMSVII